MVGRKIQTKQRLEWKKIEIDARYVSLEIEVKMNVGSIDVQILSARVTNMLCCERLN
jgi:hypothetical protein